MADLEEKIIIIGASVSGLACAKRIRRLNERVDITVIDSNDYIGYPITGIPYFVAGLLKSKETFTIGHEENLKEVYNINLLKSSMVYKIDFPNQIIYIKNLKTGEFHEERYSYLIIATGLKIDVPNVAGINCNNIFKIRNIEEAIKAREYLEKSGVARVTIIGDNIIALSFVNSFLTAGYEVDLVTKNLRLFNQFDQEFSFLIEEELIKKGVRIYKNFQLFKFKKNNNIAISMVSNSIDIDIKAVFFFEDLVPNSGFIDRTIVLSGINNNAIMVNENFNTYFNNVYATGAVIEITDKITEKNLYTLSVRESSLRGRILANVLCNKILENIGFDKNNLKYNGYIRNDFITIKNFNAGIVGISEQQAKDSDFNVFTITLVCGDRERFTYSKNKIYLKLVIDRVNRKILGAQICGTESNIDKRLDVLYTAIYSGLVVDDLINLNLAYSPEISLIRDPINLLGMISSNALDGITNYITDFDFNLNENIFILDVRTKKEREKSFLLKSYWIPLNQLRKRLNEIPKEKRIYIYGNNGVRGYIAERILKQNGFNLVYNIGGGINFVKIKEKIF